MARSSMSGRSNPPHDKSGRAVRLIPVFIPVADKTDPSDIFANPRVAASALFFDEQGDRAPPPDQPPIDGDSEPTATAGKH
jgi:hypothetical protein